MNGAYSIPISLSADSSNTWQIGVPQKIIFNTASTIPNAIITDTINTYPVNDTSFFEYELSPNAWGYGVMALQWKQKLDMDRGKDGGLVEFSIDSGATWMNSFTSPYVYNYYGFDSINVDALENGVLAYTGTDSSWRDIWLCYDLNWLSAYGKVLFRHTFVSDSIDNNKEGWMIDNLIAHVTIIHTVNEVKQNEYLTIGPNPSSGRIDIEAKKINDYHIIETIELVNADGRVVQEWHHVPTKFFIDISQHPNGIYLLNVTTNQASKSIKIVLDK